MQKLLTPSTLSILLVSIALLSSRSTNAGGKPIVQHSKVVTFLPAGDYGGGVLEPGTTYPPKGSSATLKRTADSMSVNIATTGLPAGVYTVWWVVWNNPAACMDGCGPDDLLNPQPVWTFSFARLIWLVRTERPISKIPCSPPI